MDLGQKYMMEGGSAERIGPLQSLHGSETPGLIYSSYFSFFSSWDLKGLCPGGYGWNCGSSCKGFITADTWGVAILTSPAQSLRQLPTLLGCDDFLGEEDDLARVVC